MPVVPHASQCLPRIADGAWLMLRLGRYLLEKSRIVWQAAGERNFHIFVEIFHLPQDKLARYALTRPEDFFYINQGGCVKVDGWDDKEEIEAVQAAFSRLGVDATSVFDIVAGILWVGQTKFLGRGQDTAVTIEDKSSVSRAAQLLGLDEEGFANSLTTRKVKAGGDTVITPLNYEQACAARDGISKHVYNQLFDYINTAINEGVARVRTGEKVRAVRSPSNQTREPHASCVCRCRAPLPLVCSTFSDLSASP